MSDPRIRTALELHLAAMAPQILTAYQNQNFTPPTSASKLPYQEAWLMPARNRGMTVKRGTTLHRGIFQINLCYPAAQGTQGAESRGAALQQHFDAATTKLTQGGITVRITEKATIGQPLDTRPGFFVIPVSIPYESIF